MFSTPMKNGGFKPYKITLSWIGVERTFIPNSKGANVEIKLVKPKIILPWSTGLRFEPGVVFEHAWGLHMTHTKLLKNDQKNDTDACQKN